MGCEKEQVLALFNTCEDDYASAMLLDAVATHFELVSASVDGEDADYIKVIELLKQASKLMKRGGEQV